MSQADCLVATIDGFENGTRIPRSGSYRIICFEASPITAERVGSDIYRNCADRPERFLGKVIPLILPDAALGSLANRLQRAIYWTKQEEELKPLVADNVGTVGTEFFRKFKLIGEFGRQHLEHAGTLGGQA